MDCKACNGGRSVWGACPVCLGSGEAGAADETVIGHTVLVEGPARFARVTAPKASAIVVGSLEAAQAFVARENADAHPGVRWTVGQAVAGRECRGVYSRLPVFNAGGTALAVEGGEGIGGFYAARRAG